MAQDDLTPIELELKKRCEKDDLHYFVTCQQMLDYLKNEQYPYIRDQNPWFNDHGINHTRAILNSISTMLSKYLIAVKELRNETSEITYQKLYLSTEDIYVLISASMWHDVAMIEMRQGHGAFLMKYAPKINEYTHNKDLTSCIMDVAISHSEKEKFHKCLPNMRITVNSKHSEPINIQAKLLAAILRFSDEISEDKGRATSDIDIIKKVLGKHNEIYWRHTQSINYSKYEFEERRVIIDYEIDEKYAFTQYKITEDSTETKSLIEFIVNRIKKINDERVLCGPFFSCYCPVDSVCVNLRFFKSSDQGFRESYIHEIQNISISSYPNSDSSHELKDFLMAYPDLDTNRIKDEVIRRRGSN